MLAMSLAGMLLIAACGGGSVSFETRSASDSATAGTGDDSTGTTVQGGALPPAGGSDDGTGDVGGPNGSGDDGGTTGNRGVIKLGTVLPLQGGQRDFGESILRTTRAYIDELNARGGIDGYKLELVAYNACLLCQQDALQAVRRLVEQDKVFAIVNTYVMVVAFQPVIPYLVEKGVPLIQGGAENQTSDALSPVNFATAPPGAFYAKFIPAMVTGYTDAERVGIAYLDVPSEAAGVPVLREELEDAGIEVVAEEAVGAAEDAVTNMDGIVIRMRAAGAEAVVATNPIVVIFGRLAAKRQSWAEPWVGPAAWSSLVEESCGATCDDLVLTDTAGLSFTDRDSPQMREFIDTMNRRVPGGPQTGHELAAWVGMQLTTEVLHRTGKPDRAAFLREMEQVRGLDLGTTSPLNFSPDRHLGGTTSTLIKLRNGRYYRFSEPLTFGYRE